MECFEECAHHVATGVPKEDWAEWATLLSTSEECGDGAPALSDGLTGGSGQHAAVSPMHRNRLDKLACVDEVSNNRNGSFMIYRGENKGLFVLLSRTQAGPGRTVKLEQEEISRNHVQTFISPSV